MYNMILSAILLLLMTALIAKIIYDVQKYKVQKLEIVRLQINAGIEVEEHLVEELRMHIKSQQEKLKKQAQKTAKNRSNKALPLAQTAAEKVLADLGELERIQQRKANKEKICP